MPAIFETVEEQSLTNQVSTALQGVPLAETLTVPGARIVSIEHPCIIRNLENGIKSMGGEPRMKHLLEHHVGDSALTPQKPKPEPELGVALQPEDPLAPKLTSVGVPTRNVLVKITMPRRTGRKRKRGTSDAFEDFEDSPNSSLTAPDLLKRLRDNESKYSIELVGSVNETHRFRGLPDFQTIASDAPIFQELRAHVLDAKWSSIKDFSLDMSVGLPPLSTFPGPPSFAASATQPYRYEYQQAAGVRFSRDEDGKIRSLNLQAPARKVVKRIAPDIEEVPTGPPADLKPHNPYSNFLPRVIKGLTELLEERPLVTRRVAMNTMPDCNETVFREATQWVSYSFMAGPFRDTLIKYGVDPRKDPKYRRYQTLMFQLDKRAAKANNDSSGKWNRTARHIPDTAQPENISHIFDGEHVSTNGKTWQICDLTDPVLKQIFDTEALKEECDVYSSGWYKDSTICKARLIMREKMEKLFEGSPVPNDVYATLATMPDDVEPFSYEYAQQYFADKPGGKEAASLATEVRNMVKAGRQGFRRAAEGKDDVDKEGEAIVEDPLQGDLDE